MITIYHHFTDNTYHTRREVIRREQGIIGEQYRKLTPDQAAKLLRQRNIDPSTITE